jgi:hypothetical protein
VYPWLVGETKRKFCLLFFVVSSSEWQRETWRSLNINMFAPQGKAKRNVSRARNGFEEVEIKNTTSHSVRQTLKQMLANFFMRQRIKMNEPFYEDKTILYGVVCRIYTKRPGSNLLLFLLFKHFLPRQKLMLSKIKGKRYK